MISEAAGNHRDYSASSLSMRAPSTPTVAGGNYGGRKMSFAALFASAGAVSFALCCWVLCSAKHVGTSAHADTVPHAAYEWPMVAFGAAFVMNLLTLAFERESYKMQLALLACYINVLAGTSHALHFLQLTPVVTDIWGQDVEVVRIVMWLHTTPAMVYLLSMISDFSRSTVHLVMTVDAAMIALLLLHHLLPSPALSLMALCGAGSAFLYVMSSLWHMFSTPVREATAVGSKQSLQALRLYTVVLWSSFPLLKMVQYSGQVPVGAMAMLWGAADLLGKIVFSSSLLLGNFVSVEQRRLMAMRVVEEGNRLQVIEELKELVEQKEKFLSSTSHELRTPLNGIIGLSEAMLVGSCGELNESARKTVATIKTSGSRLLNLINDILDASAMKRAVLVIKHEKVNLRSVADDVIELCQPLAKRAVKLRNDVPEGLPPVLGDAGRIIQILYNLVGNACKFTHKGSISVSAVAKEGTVEVTVSDSGIGIPENKFESIFNQFEQVDMSTTRKYGGTGLGLALVKSLVEAHGGDISIASRVGHGTTFTFSFQLWTQEHEYNRLHDAQSRRTTATSAAPSGPPSRRTSVDLPSTAPPQAPQPSQSSAMKANSPSPEPLATIPESSAAGGEDPHARRSDGRHPLQTRPSFRQQHEKVQVLSVDDDPVNQMVISNLLGPAGYEIVQAMDGEEALQHLQKGDTMPDIILLDVMMPGMSGYEVCRKVREMFPESCTPIIMISARSKEEAVVEGLTSGSNDYVTKPFRRQELLARIHSQLDFKHRVETSITRSAFPSGHAANPQALSTIPLGSTPSSIMAPNSRRLLPEAVIEQLGHTDDEAYCEDLPSVVFLSARIRNLPQLVAGVHARDLVVALSNFAMMEESLLQQHGLFRVEALDESEVFVAGIGGAPGGDPVNQALEFAAALLELVQGVQVGSQTLDVGIALHRGAATAVMTGYQHPVLQFLGPDPVEVVRLEALCPPACVMVSEGVVAGRPKDEFMQVSRATWLWKVGQWEQWAGPRMHQLPDATQVAPAVNLHATGLTPLQQALIVLVLLHPLMLWECSVVAAEAGQGRGAQGTEGGRDEGGAHREMEHKLEVVEMQLQKVTEEAQRLQEEVDRLELDIAAQQGRESARQEEAQQLLQQLGEEREGSRQLRIEVEALMAARADEKAAHGREVEALQAALQTQMQAARDASPLKGRPSPTAHSLSNHSTPIPACMDPHNLPPLEPSVPAPPQPLRPSKDATRPPSAQASSEPPPRSSASTSPFAGPPRTSLSSSVHPATSVVPPTTQSTPTYHVASVQEQHHTPFPPGMPLAVAGAPLGGWLLGADNEALAALRSRGAGELEEALLAVGLSSLVDRFQQEEVDPSLLPLLDEGSLRQLGVHTVGARLRLQMALQTLLHQK